MGLFFDYLGPVHKKHNALWPHNTSMLVLLTTAKSSAHDAQLLELWL